MTTARGVTPGARPRRLTGQRAALAAALLLGLWLVLASSVSAGAASPEVAPSPTPATTAGILETGDPRSNGQGPGLVGSPVAILVGVLLLGAGTAGGTLLFLRVTRKN